MADRLLTAPEVAERLQLTTDFVYGLCRRGEIPHLRFGRTLRFRAEAIDTWLRDQEQDANNIRGARKWASYSDSPAASRASSVRGAADSRRVLRFTSPRQGPQPTTLNLSFAGVGSRWPSGSTAWTANVCFPSSRFLTVTGDLHALNAFLSSLH